MGSVPGSGRSPGGGNSNPSGFLPGKSHRQRSLVGYSPGVTNMSDTTYRLNNNGGRGDGQEEEEEEEENECTGTRFHLRGTKMFQN